MIKTKFGVFYTFLVVNDVEPSKAYASVLKTNDASMVFLGMANNMNLMFLTTNNNCSKIRGIFSNWVRRNIKNNNNNNQNHPGLRTKWFFRSE